MSKELEMLREMAKDTKRIYIDRLAFSIILARLEAAERVCESVDERERTLAEYRDDLKYRSSRQYDIDEGAKIEDAMSAAKAALADALRAYRALDGKGEG